MLVRLHGYVGLSKLCWSQMEYHLSTNSHVMAQLKILCHLINATAETHHHCKFSFFKDFLFVNS